MAAAHCATAATASFHFPPARKSPLLISAMCTRFPSKRKNYLRTDILKTQTEPFPKPILPEIPPANPLIPLESALEQQQQPEFPSDESPSEEVKESDPIEQQPPDVPSDQFVGEEMKEFASVGKQPELPSNQFSSEEVKGYDPIERKPGFDFDRFLSKNIQESEVREISFSETTRSAELVNGVAGNYLSPTQIGLGFVLACVIDVIWSLWMAKSLKLSGSVDGNNKPKSELLSKEEGNSIEIKNGGVVSVDESASDKIVEIRELAREVREKEELESKGNDSEKVDDDGVVLESVIKKEDDD